MFYQRSLLHKELCHLNILAKNSNLLLISLLMLFLIHVKKLSLSGRRILFAIICTGLTCLPFLIVDQFVDLWRLLWLLWLCIIWLLVYYTWWMLNINMSSRPVTLCINQSITDCVCTTFTQFLHHEAPLSEYGLFTCCNYRQIKYHCICVFVFARLYPNWSLY